MSVTVRIEDTEEFSFNMSNKNFGDFMRFIGVEVNRDLAGVFAVDRSSYILARVCQIYHTDEGYLFTEPTFKEQNITFIGRDIMSVRSRLTDFMLLFSRAILDNKKVHYA